MSIKEPTHPTAAISAASDAQVEGAAECGAERSAARSAEFATQRAADTAKSDADLSSIITQMLQRKVGATRFELWFSHQSPLTFTEGRVEVSADSNFTANRLQNTFSKDIRSVVDHVCGTHVGIEFVVKLPPVKTAGRKNASRKNSSPPNNAGQGDVNDQRSLFDTAAVPSNPTDAVNRADNRPSPPAHADDNNYRNANLQSNTRPTLPQARPASRDLDSFWFGANNQFAKAGVEQILQLPGQFSPLLIHGPSGSGKSHLVEAATHEYRRRLGAKRSLFLTAEQFTNQFVASLRDNRGLPMFRRKFRDLDLLAIDDIQFLFGKNATLNEFQFTLDHLVRQGKQVIVSSDRPPMELDTLGSDLLNRLASGLMCPLMFPNLDGRKSIIASMCRERSFRLSPDVIELIAEQITRDVRRLSGAINRLRAVSISAGIEKVTVQFARDALQDLISLSTIGTSMVTIEEAVCDLTGVKPADLRSNSRRKSISSARMLAMYLARQHTNAALSEIGDHFGGRSHSTVIAAKKKINSLIADDSDIALANSKMKVKAVIDRIESKLRIG